MVPSKKYPAIKLIILSALAVFNFSFAYVVVRSGAGYEMNPVNNSVFFLRWDWDGIAPLLIHFLVLLAMIATVLRYCRFGGPKTIKIADKTLLVLIFLYSAVNLFNIVFYLAS